MPLGSEERNKMKLDTRTQQIRIISLLRERGKKGVFVYEITNSRPQGLGVSQYNARISELRDMDFDIENVKPGHFVLKYDCGAFLTKPKPITHEVFYGNFGGIHQGSKEDCSKCGTQLQITGLSG